MKFNLIVIILLGLITFSLSKETNKKPKKITTEITITTTSDDEDSSEPNEENEEEKIVDEEKNTRKNGTESQKEKEKEKQISEKKQKEKEIREEEEKKKKEEEKTKEEEEEDEEIDKGKRKEKTIRDAQKTIKEISPDKILVLSAPYEDNEDFIITSMGFGTPISFLPLQLDTTSYKTWVASALNKESPSSFCYDKKDSKTAEEPGEWDTVVDEEGTISGNIVYDKVKLGKFEINHFKFIEAVEYEDGFNDFKNGKIGLGNCYYADDNELEYCLLQKLKDNGSIERRIFSIREESDTHGEIVIGDVSSISKENDYPLLSVVDKSTYDDIDDDEFKMSWLTKVSHVIFRNNPDEKIKNIFKNQNIYIEDGLASFDSSGHYIEAPYSYMNEFQEKMFDIFYPNACRRVNNDGIYMFLCDKERFEQIQDNNKDLSLIIVMDGNGFEIPMNLLFEQTRKNDYEFFVHFKDYEQNIWNLGHPFFHHYTIIFDQDNQEIGIDGENILSLKDEVEDALKKKIGSFTWWKVVLLALVGFLLLAGIFWFLRYMGIKYKIDNGVSPSLVDNESADDLSFPPGQNVH